MKRFFLIFCCVCGATLFAQSPNIEWKKSIGSAYDNEYSYSMIENYDKTIVQIGYGPGTHPCTDIILLKTDSLGNVLWNKFYGGNGTDQGYCINTTRDSGFIFTGLTHSNTDDITDNPYGAQAIWVVKLDKMAVIQWEKCLFYGTMPQGNYIQQTKDGGYILAATTTGCLFSGPYSNSASDFVVVKLDSAGNTQWHQCFGGTLNDYVASVKQLFNGDYIVASTTNSTDMDATSNHGIFPGYSTDDYLIVCLDSSGNTKWERCYGSTQNDELWSLEITKDQKIIVTGSCALSDGDAIGTSYGGSDLWVLKIDTNGAILWQKRFGGSGSETGYSIAKDNSNGFIISGETSSSDGEVTGYHTNGSCAATCYDYWLLKLDSIGNLTWQKTLGGSNSDYSFSALQSKSGDYYITGMSESNDGDVTSSPSTLYEFVWFVKLNESGQTTDIRQTIKEGDFVVFPNPTSHKIEILCDKIFEQIIIQDAYGNQVIQTKDRQIDLSALPNGIYFIRVGNKIQSFVKQ
ncbi:MAG: T9SS type A sorting domain-containing protein [Bacteroidia bacterium]